MAHSWICRGCQQPTLDGPLCSSCSGGRNGAARNPLYASRTWRRKRDQLVRDHVAVHGQRCTRCGSRTDSRNPLTVDHQQPLSRGGTLLQATLQVVCRRCNSSLGNRQSRGPRRRGRRGAMTSGGD